MIVGIAGKKLRAHAALGQAALVPTFRRPYFHPSKSVRGRLAPGGFMNILAALTQAEAKLKKQADIVRRQLDAVLAAVKILGEFCAG